MANTRTRKINQNVELNTTYDFVANDGTFSGVVTGTSFVGPLTGDVTGTVSSLSNHDTGDLIEGTNLYFTTARARAAFSAGTGVNITSGVISIGQSVSTVSDVTFGSVTAATFSGALTGDVTGNADTASALEAAVNIALIGSVTGNADFDGSGNISITTTTNHNHDDRYYTETESDGKYLLNTTDTLDGNLTVTGDLNVTGTIDLSNADLNIGAADIIFDTASGGSTRGLIWNVTGTGFLSKLIGGGADGGKVTLFANMDDAITTGNIFEIKDGSLGSLFLGLSHAGTLTTSDLIANTITASSTNLSGNLTLSYAYPRINLIDTNNDSDYSIINNDGTFSVYDITNNIHRFSIASGGDISISNNLAITGTLSASGYNKSNWDTAYGWGNHSLASYTKFNAGRFTGDLNTIGVSNASSGIYSIGYPYTNGPGGTALYGTLYSFWNEDISVQIWPTYNGDFYWRKSVGASFTDSVWRTIWDTSHFSLTDIGNWNTAFGWGNHAGLYASVNHTHIISAISETAVPSAGISIQAGPGSNNTQGWEYPYGTRLSAIISGGRSFEIMSTTYPNGGLVMRTLDGSNVWDAWKTIIDSSNIGSQSVNYATTAGSANSVAWGNISSIPSLWYQSGSWLADFGSYSFVRENGVTMSGGSEFVLLSRSGQGHVLIDGSYWAGEQGGFYSLNTSNQYTSQVGFSRDSNAFAAFNTTVSAVNDMRAPIFYDSNDTNYYVNANSSSKLYSLGLGGVSPDVLLSVNGDSHFAGYLYQGGTGGTVNSWGSRTLVSGGNYVSNARSFAFNNEGYGSNWTFSISAAGNVLTNRHIDANTTWTNSATTLFLGWYSGKTVIGNDNNSNHDNAAALGANTIAVTNPLYSFTNTQSPIFYDSNDTGYYVDPNGVSRVSELRVNELSFIDGSGVWSNIIRSAAYPSEGYSTGSNYWLEYRAKGGHHFVLNTDGGVGSSLNSMDDFTIWQGALDGNRLFEVTNAGNVTATADMRAPIFYDSNDTGYYANLASATSLYINGGVNQNNLVGRPYAVWAAGGGITGAVVIKFPGGTGNYGMIHAVIDIYEYSGDYGCTVIVSGHNWNGAWYNYGAQLIGRTNKPVRIGVKDGKYCIVIGNGSSSWSYGQVVLRKIQNGAYYQNVMNVGEGYTVNIESDSYSWISSDLRQLNITGNIISSVDMRAPIFYDTDNTGYYLDPANGGVALRISGAIQGDHVGWTGEHNKIQWHSSHMYFQNMNDGYWLFRRSNGSEPFQLHADGWAVATNSWRAPIFYDSNNTAYYVNPDAYSQLSYGNFNAAPNGRSLSLGGDDNSRVYNDGNRSSLVINAPYYPHLYINAMSNGSNSTHGPVLSMSGVLSGGGYRRWGMGIANTDPDCFSWGYYDNESNPHYGVGGQFGYTGTNSKMWLNTGGSLMTSGDMRAPIYYDSNNTSYYVDPNGETVLGGPLRIDYSNAYLWVKSVHSSTGIQWHDQIWLGRYDRLQASGAYPTYLPGAAYGVHVTQSSDSCFFGLISRGANYNDYNTVIAWADDGPEDVLQFRFNNNVVGTITPSGALTMSSDITAYSDARVKENITTIDNALDKILNLRGVYYNRTDLEYDKSKKIGVIAQEIIEVLPEVVAEDQDGMLGVSYGNITAVLIEAIKEQQKQIEELKAIVNGLTK